MAFQKININAPFFSNLEDESRSSVVAEQRRDVIKDSLGSTIKRPGLSVFSDQLNLPAVGLFYWRKTDLVYFVSDTNLYSLDKDGNVSEIETGLFTRNQNVVWAESPDLTLITTGATRKLFITNGGRIVEYDGTTASQLTDSDAPTEPTHLIMFDTYLMANDLSDPKYDETILFSEVADPTNFQGKFFSAENKSDKLNAIHTAWDEIALFGPDSIENYYNNGVEPFVPIPGGNVQDGTLSPWSIKMSGGSYFYLNSHRKVVRLSGRQPTEISIAIDNILDDSPDFRSAEGDIVTIGNYKLYLLTINERTFVYDFSLNEWVGEWGYWNKIKAQYEKFKARSFLDIKQWGVTLCCDKSDGKIYKLDFDGYQDNGNEIRSSVITGNIDHGTGRIKRSNELRLRLKRGKVIQTTIDQESPKLLVRWKDDGQDTWSNWRAVDLGFSGDKKFYYSLFQLGAYRSRQYEFMCSDNTPFSIVEIEEDVTLER